MATFLTEKIEAEHMHTLLKEIFYHKEFYDEDVCRNARIIIKDWNITVIGNKVFFACRACGIIFTFRFVNIPIDSNTRTNLLNGIELTAVNAASNALDKTTVLLREITRNDEAMINAGHEKFKWQTNTDLDLIHDRIRNAVVAYIAVWLI